MAFESNSVVGTVIDGFHIRRVLGQGGMGVVYEAEDQALARTVALKMIDPALARDEIFLRRFRSEARALARIDSPHIVGIHALRQTEVGVFIVMEYVDGGTVADLIEGGSVSWQRAQPLVRQMLLALDAAHGVGVTHRDIKPRNIMITRGGTVKVTDFGLAKLQQQADAASTMTQGIAGTLYYMSPEQVRGLRDLDHRSDVYSLGMMLYEMFAGRLPFDTGSSQFAIMRAIVEEPLLPLDQVNPAVPAELSRLVMKALEKDPANRFQSAREMLDVAEDLEALSPPPSDAATVVEGMAPYAPAAPRPRRGLLWGALGAFGVLLGIAGFLLYRSFLSGPSSAPATLAVTSSPPGAQVLVDGRAVGTTPLEGHALAGERVSLAVRLEGYQDLDSTLNVADGQRLDLALQLQPLPTDTGADTGTVAAQFASLEITSTPSGAAVWIGNERLGPTPYTGTQMPPGTYTLRVEKQGFAPWQRVGLTLLAGQRQTLDVSLTPLQPAQREANTPPREAPPPLARNATLAVRAVPGGPVAVDGKTLDDSGSMVVAAGRRTVRCGEPPFAVETQVTLAAGAREELICYFERSVNVTVRGAPWGTILINGQEYTAGTAPGLITLRPGRHRIAVRRHGYEMVGNERVLNVKPSFSSNPDTLSFRLRAQ